MGNKAPKRSQTATCEKTADWDDVVDQIYAQYDISHSGSISKHHMIEFAQQLGISEEEATNGADAFFSLVAAEDSVTRHSLDQFLRLRVIKAGHHGVPHTDDVALLRQTFDFSLAQIPGHLKLMRQTSEEYRQNNNTCHLCRTQKSVQNLYRLKGQTQNVGEDIEPDDGLGPVPLARQSSQDFIRSLRTRMCCHSFCPGCLRENILKQIESQSRPVCPVCDELIGFLDLENILTETEFVTYTCTMYSMQSSILISQCPTCSSAITSDNKITLDAEVKRMSCDQKLPERLVCQCDSCGALCALCGLSQHECDSSMCPTGLVLQAQLILEAIDQLKGLPSLRQPPVVSTQGTSSAETKTSSGKAGVGFGGAGDVGDDDEDEWWDEDGDGYYSNPLAQADAKARAASRLQRKERHVQIARLVDLLVTCLSHGSLRTHVPPALFSILFQSRFNVHLADFYRAGFMEMTEHLELAHAMLELTRVVSSNPWLLPLLRPSPTGGDLKTQQVVQYSIPKLLQEVLKQVKLLAKAPKIRDSKDGKEATEAKQGGKEAIENVSDGKTGKAAEESPAVKTEEKGGGEAGEKKGEKKAPGEEPAAVDVDVEELKVMSVVDELKATGEVVRTHCRLYVKDKQRLQLFFSAEEHSHSKDLKEEGEVEEKTQLEENKVEVDPERVAVEEFMQCRLTTSRITAANAPLKHVFEKEFKNPNAQRPSSKKMIRIRQEMAALSNSLPWGIFVSFDETRFDVLRCLIIGAEGTPYQNGCFLFDMYIPPNYPQVPPKCKIITTGKASFRFNANLYTNGKVCLSVLGTWQGPGWDPDMSTILQVLLSIQAMIMCEDPIQNEPSWEHKIGRPEGIRYDRSIRHATLLYALKWHLEAPPYGFEDVVRCHCWLNKDALLTQIAEWEAEEKIPCSARAGCNYRGEDEVKQETFTETATSLRALLQNLQRPDVHNLDSDSDSDSDSDDSDDDSDD